MAIRSTTSAFQPSPPNYRLAGTGVYRNVGRYASVTSSSNHPANMSTAPVPGSNHTQYQYVPRVSG